MTALVKYIFTVQHKILFDERKERILNQKVAGLGHLLAPWDRMEENSLAFYKLNVTGKEHFYEISIPEFDKVIDRLEQKSNTKGEEIHNLEKMR